LVYNNNAPLVSQPIANQTIRLDKTLDINLAQVFSDPEGQQLTFTGQSTSLAGVTILGSVLKITPKAIGATVISVKAADFFNESATTQFTLTIIPKNESPIVSNSIQTLELKIVGLKKDSASIDLSNHFIDPNKDPLVFTASVSNQTILSYKLRNNLLTLYASQPGNTTVTITAKDPENLFATFDLKATVTIITAIEPLPNKESLVVTPNPVATTASIQYWLERSDVVNLSIQDLQGRRIMPLLNELQTAGQHKVTLSADDLSGGVYIVYLTTGSNVLVKRIIVVR
jgi:hypothetical protein